MLLSIPPPGLGLPDDLQISDLAGAQNRKRAPGDPSWEDPGQKVVPGAVLNTRLRHPAGLHPKPV